jgi:hypothetical protein
MILDVKADTVSIRVFKNLCGMYYQILRDSAYASWVNVTVCI